MTNQEVIERVKAAFPDRESCSVEGTKCLYRGPNGKKCAFGLFIPDDEYDPDFDHSDMSGLSASEVLKILEYPEWAMIEELTKEQSIYYWGAMQRAHDWFGRGYIDLENFHLRLSEAFESAKL